MIYCLKSLILKIFFNCLKDILLSFFVFILDFLYGCYKKLCK